MKKIILIGFVLCSFGLSAQSTVYTSKNSVLVVLGDKFSLLSFFKVNPNHIKSANILKAENAMPIYGEKAKNGALEITLKDGVRILNFDEIFSKYNISRQDQNLPLVVNRSFVKEKEKWLIDESVITSVKILEEQPFVEPVLLPKGKAIYIEVMETK